MEFTETGGIAAPTRRSPSITLAATRFVAVACGHGAPPAPTASSEAMKEVYAAYGVSVARRAGSTLYIGGLVAF